MKLTTNKSKMSNIESFYILFGLADESYYKNANCLKAKIG